MLALTTYCTTDTNKSSLHSYLSLAASRAFNIIHYPHIYEYLVSLVLAIADAHVGPRPHLLCRNILRLASR